MQSTSRNLLQDDLVTPLTGVIISGNFVTAGFDVRHARGYEVQISCPGTGSPSGTFILQSCADSTLKDLSGSASSQPDAGLVNWADLAAGGDRVVTSGAVSGAGCYVLKDPITTSKWIRVKYTGTGSCTVTIKIHFKV